MLKSTQAALSSMKGQLRSTIVRLPGWKLQMSGFFGDRPFGEGMSMKLSRRLRRSLSGPFCLSLSPSTRSLFLNIA